MHGDPEFCRLVGGAGADCHLEGYRAKRAACEAELIGGCPVWEYRTATHAPARCHDNQNDAEDPVSCDHFGSPASGQDDPKTPTTGDSLEALRGFEGTPAFCGLQRDAFGPVAGFFVVAHGKGDVQACGPTLPPERCSGWAAFEH